MHERAWRALAALLAAAAAGEAEAVRVGPGFGLANAEKFELVKTFNNSTLHHAVLTDATTGEPSDAYDWPIEVLYLKGSRYDIGFAYANLIGDEVKPTYDSFISSLLGGMNPLKEEAVRLLSALLDWQWESYLSKALTSEHREELQGLREGGDAVGVPELYTVVTRLITLANLPGDPSNTYRVLVREFEEHHKGTDALMRITGGKPVAEVLERVLSVMQPGHQCSMIAAWGSRTKNGDVYAGRNLDWNKDTGVAKHKTLTIFAPDDGAHPHAIVGFAGLYGAIAGISAAGLTVHEANLEQSEITFDGYPWVLRLRLVMERASDLMSARKVMDGTNNTVGFNHMVSSAADKDAASAANVFETKAMYTATFGSMDTREADAVYEYRNGTTVGIGRPMSEALWRTNHPYDPETRRTFLWSQAPTSWSMVRYNIIADQFQRYEDAGLPLTYLEMLNITALAGDKGHSHPYKCDGPDGTNVISTLGVPTQGIFYVAFENGHAETYTTACCTAYVRFDVGSLWGGVPSSSRGVHEDAAAATATARRLLRAT